MRFRVRIVRQDGAFMADCADAPGCKGEGATREEAVSNMKVALKGHMARKKKQKSTLPPLASTEP